MPELTVKMGRIISSTDSYRSSHGRAYDHNQSTTGRWPGLSFIYFPWIKARSCSRIWFFFMYFWLLTFSGGDQENDGQPMPMNIGAAPTTTPRYVLVRERLRMETRTSHTWVLLPSNATSKCGGGMWVARVSPFHASSYLGLYMVLTLASFYIKIK